MLIGMENLKNKYYPNLHATQNKAKHDGLEVTGSHDTTAPFPERTPLKMPAGTDTHRGMEAYKDRGFC